MIWTAKLITLGRYCLFFLGYRYLRKLALLLLSSKSQRQDLLRN